MFFQQNFVWIIFNFTIIEKQTVRIDHIELKATLCNKHIKFVNMWLFVDFNFNIYIDVHTF